MGTTIKYEARLNRNIKRLYYSWTTYKKGTLITTFTESQFKKLNKKNICRNFSPQIVLGHGASEYFDIKDIDFFEVKTYIKKVSKKVKLT